MTLTHPVLMTIKKSCFPKHCRILENLEIRKSVSLLVVITQSPEGAKLNSSFIPLYGVWWDFGGILVTGNQSSYIRVTHKLT